MLIPKNLTFLSTGTKSHSDQVPSLKCFHFIVPASCTLHPSHPPHYILLQLHLSHLRTHFNVMGCIRIWGYSLLLRNHTSLDVLTHRLAQGGEGGNAIFFTRSFVDRCSRGPNSNPSARLCRQKFLKKWQTKNLPLVRIFYATVSFF